MNELKIGNISSIYIHIPFCKRKCNYCAFVSFTNITEFETAYIEALTKEIKNHFSNDEIKTIYLGGGTPNLLSLKSLEKIFSTLNKNFSISNNAEITMEFNPKISDISYIKEVKNIGVNRISLGAQSFNDEILKTLNRIHTSQDTYKMIENIKEAGITNFNIDLIYGIFGQTMNNIKNDLKIIKDISPTHISTYGLKIEKGTPFEKYDTTNLPNEDLCADMYTLISDTLENSNYKHYEISNFAQENYESKHNLAYWKCQEYFGFGVSAHGYCNKIRYQNSDNLQNYIQNPTKKEILTVNKENDLLEETIMLGLRLKNGININHINKEFKVNLLETKAQEIKNLIDYKFAKLENGQLYLTTKGFLISNYIISQLIK